MYKKILLFLLLTTPCTLLAEQFDLSQELNASAVITEVQERLSSFQHITENIAETDSPRLLKKLLKLIKNLHTICFDEEDVEIKSAYHTLLETTIENEKLLALDYTGEIKKLIELYKGSEPLGEEIAPALEPEIAPEEIEERETETISEEDQRDAKISQLYANAQHINREAVLEKLSLRKVLNDLTNMTSELQALEHKVARLTEQNKIIALMYKKLLKIEHFISGETLLKGPQEAINSLEEELLFSF